VTTAFMIAKFEFSQTQKEELVRRGLSEGVVDELQAELEIVKSFETTEPATRREMIKQLDAIAKAFKAAEETIDTTNHWTVSNLQPRVYGLQRCDYRGRPKTNILLRELKHALTAYRDGTEQAKRNLATGTHPKRGPAPEYAMHVASAVKTVLERAGVALSDDEKGTLTQTISIAFEALGIKKGEPRQFAAKILAARK
jgi:hypothetical protein